MFLSANQLGLREHVPTHRLLEVGFRRLAEVAEVRVEKAFVPGGAPLHESGGVVPGPSQVWTTGISPFASNAAELSLKAIVAFGFSAVRRISGAAFAARQLKNGMACAAICSMRPRFQDRREGGERLAEKLRGYANRPNVIVLALPRGGVPVAFEVAEALHAPLEVFVVRKLGVPGQEELALGALASGGLQVLDDELIRLARVSRADIERMTAAASAELSRQEARYRGERPFPNITGKTVILVDDGLATGSTMRAAVQGLRAQHPASIIVAVPVGAAETCDALRAIADAVVCLETPDPFRAVGLWYHDFSQTTDDEVHALLERARHAAPVT